MIKALPMAAAAMLGLAVAPSLIARVQAAVERVAAPIAVSEIFQFGQEALRAHPFGRHL